MSEERTAPDAVLPRPISMPGDPFVVAQPVLPVEAAHVAEARRALRAQGRGVPLDEDLVRALWIARCLPVALDVLADALSPLPLGDAEILGVDVELGVAPTERRSLLAVGYAVAPRPPRPDELGVIVEVVEKRALVLARDDDAPPCCVVRFLVGRRGARDGAARGEEGSDPAVPLLRFTVGSPPR